MIAASVHLPFAPLDLQLQEAKTIRIQWKTFLEDSTISPNEMAVLIDVDDEEKWSELLTKDGGVYLTTLLQVLGKIGDPDAHLVILSTIYEMLTQFPNLCKAAIRQAGEKFPFASLSQQISSQEHDETTTCHSSRILATLAFMNDGLPPNDGKVLLDWIETCLLLSSEDREQCLLLSTLLLEHILRAPSLRSSFVSRVDCVAALATTLLRSRNIQIQYQAVFAIWLLTFDPKIAYLIQFQYRIIPTLLDVSRNAVKDKTVRICIAIWRNYLCTLPKMAIPIMVGCKIAEHLDNLSPNKVADEEVSADVSILKESLAAAMNSLNSFDEYASEVKSGKLAWSPPHKSELFWQDNRSRMGENECELLRILSSLLEPSNDTMTLSVAANDIGMYVSNNPMGRRNVELLGIKTKIMTLIYHGDPEVRYHALTSMQKYMKDMWATV